jgi:predicted DNA-binding protein (MmcQ/YjbR family)
MPRVERASKKAEKALRAFALAYPEAREDFPWGERVIKVKNKVFVFLGGRDNGLSISTKLPNSAGAAATLPFAEPTGYGLGKSGWITARFEGNQKPPVKLLERWIDESYRAVAPKKLVEQIARKPTAKRRRAG